MSYQIFRLFMCHGEQLVNICIRTAFGLFLGNGWCCFRYRLLLLSWSTIPLALKKGKRLSEQSERINRCDSTATSKPLSIRLASHRHQKGVCHLHIIAVLSLPAVGTFRRRRRGAGRLLPTPRHQRRNPHLRFVRILPKVGSTALRCSRSAPFERSP
jgi:hypothetical protein